MTFGVGSTLRGLAALGLALCGAAFAGKAHQHGVARLDLAVDGGTVTIAVEMPLDALVGFERSPRTGAERQAAAAFALFGALSLVIGAFIACAAAALGGHQRDEEEALFLTDSRP